MSGLVLFTDPASGAMYAFCSRECQRTWAMEKGDHSPDCLSEKFGCWWCGKSVYPGGEEAWENPETRLV